MTAHLKIAVGAEGVDRLRREAAVLETARRPGVVELLGFTDEGGVAELRTATVDGRPLSSSDALDDDEVAGLAAAVATIVADLHQAGVVHGALDASHVVLGASGPVLCGFGSAGAPGPGRQPADDVAALGRLVLSLVDRGPVAETARGLGPCTAREAATAFRACVAIATLPGRSATPTGKDALANLLGGRRRSRPRRRLAAVAMVVVAVVVVAIVAGLTLAAPGGTPAPVATDSPATTPVPTTAAPTPSATLMWPSTTTGATPTIVVSGQRLAIGQPGDIALAGPFGCGASPKVAAVLRPQTGRVFVFDQAAWRGHDTTGREVAVVAGAVNLSAADGSSGCRDLLVERVGGTMVPVALEAAS